MPAIPLPGLLATDSNPLELTSGSYSQLVLDTLGDTPFDSDAQLAQADDAAVLLDGFDAANTDLESSISDAVDPGSQIGATPGSQMAADLAPARQAAGVSLGDYETIVAPTLNPTVPGQPVGQEPVPPSVAGIKYLGNVVAASYTPLEGIGGPAFKYNQSLILGTPGGPMAISADDVLGTATGFSITAVAVFADVQPLGDTEWVPSGNDLLANLYDVFTFTPNAAKEGYFQPDFAVQIDGQPTWYPFAIFYNVPQTVETAPVSSVA